MRIEPGHRKNTNGRRPATIRGLVFLVLCLLGQGAASAQVSAELDSNYAETGNPFIVHLRVLQQAGKPGQVDFSAWDSVVPEQNILRQSEWTPHGDTFSKDLTLVFFDADTILLPPLDVHLNGRGSFQTNPLQVVILATPAPNDLVDMRAIKDIHREPAWWTDYLPWILAIGGFVVLILLGAWLIDRAKMKKEKLATSRSVGMPAHELALKKLELLARKDLWSKGLYKEYCAELTFIVREYLEKRYGIPALESTSEEILEHLKKTDCPGFIQPALKEILQHADLVKFAKALPPEGFQEQTMSFARNLISKTRPPEPEPQTNTPNRNP